MVWTVKITSKEATSDGIKCTIVFSDGNVSETEVRHFGESSTLVSIAQELLNHLKKRNLAKVLSDLIIADNILDKAFTEEQLETFIGG